MIPIDEQLYPLPESWQWVTLDSVAECLDNLRSPVNSAERAKRPGKIPYYGATGQVGWIDDFLTDEQLVLLGEDGAPFLDMFKDKAYIIEGKAWVNNHAHILRSHFGNVGNKFLCYYLNAFNFSGYVNGTTRLKLTQAKMKKIPVPLPPLDEQQRIVALLDELFGKLDEAKTLAQAVVDSSKLRRAAILHKAFTGELSRLWRDEHGITLDRWQQCQLGDVCNYGRNETVQPSAMKIGKLLIDLEDIEKDSGNLIKQKIFDGTNANSSKHSFGRGDVLYGKLRPYLNKVVIADEDGYCSSEILPLNFGERALNRFAQYVLLSPDFVRYANHNSYGTNMPRLGTRAGRQAPFPLPPLEEQKEIVRVLDDLLYREQRTKDLALKTVERVELIKKSILARAFRGELGTN